MGKSKHIGKVLGLFERSPVVDFKSIERIARIKKNAKSNYAKLIVFNLLKKGTIQKLAKGKYTKYDDPSLAVLCYPPAYLGLQSALSVHGIWEQETIPIILTSRIVRIGTRTILGSHTQIRRINQKHVFGIEYLHDGAFYLPYSDKEKTFIDMVVFRQRMDERALAEFRKQLDFKKLKQYLRDYPEKTRTRVISAYRAIRF